MTEVHFDRTGIVNLHSTIHHQIGTQYTQTVTPIDSEDIKQLATEIQAVLIQVGGHQSVLTKPEQLAIAAQAKQQIEQHPLLKQRIVGALKAGSIEALKQACHHPVAEVAIATFEGWIKP